MTVKDFLVSLLFRLPALDSFQQSWTLDVGLYLLFLVTFGDEMISLDPFRRWHAISNGRSEAPYGALGLSNKSIPKNTSGHHLDGRNALNGYTHSQRLLHWGPKMTDRLAWFPKMAVLKALMWQLACVPASTNPPPFKTVYIFFGILSHSFLWMCSIVELFVVLTCRPHCEAPYSLTPSSMNGFPDLTKGDWLTVRQSSRPTGHGMRICGNACVCLCRLRVM